LVYGVSKTEVLRDEGKTGPNKHRDPERNLSSETGQGLGSRADLRDFPSEIGSSKDEASTFARTCG